MELIRFSHTVFALPFALLAAIMAWTRGAVSQPPVAWRWRELVGILVCMVAARSAAMAFNRIADRKLDAENPRTAGRHIPAGVLSVGRVAVFAAASSVIFLAGTLFFLPNPLPMWLALPVLLFILGYSYAKRMTALSHFWLGAALMLAPVSTWIAIRGQRVMADPADLLPALVLGGAVFLWVAGFDIIYACQDAGFDRQARLRSMPVLLGVRGALRLAALCHLAAVALWAALPVLFPLLGGIYWAGLGCVVVLLIYEHSVVRPDDLSRVNLAFFRINALVSIGMFLVSALDLWL